MSEQTSNARNAVPAQRGFQVKLATAGLVIAVSCAAAAIFSGIGYRLGLWHFRTGFAILQWVFWGALAAALISLAGLIVGRNTRPGVLVRGAARPADRDRHGLHPLELQANGEQRALIHDITTDVGNPPEFVAARTLRREGDHPVDVRRSGSRRATERGLSGPRAAHHQGSQGAGVRCGIVHSGEHGVRDHRREPRRRQAGGGRHDLALRIQGRHGGAHPGVCARHSSRCPFEIAGRAQRSRRQCQADPDVLEQTAQRVARELVQRATALNLPGAQDTGLTAVPCTPPSRSPAPDRRPAS